MVNLLKTSKMANIFKKILQPIEQVQNIRGVQLPVGLEFLQLIVTGPPGAGKTYYINQIRGWPNEGYIDLTLRKWWKNQNLIYRPREVHLGIPFKGFAEALTVFDKEWLEADQPLIPELDRIKIPPLGSSFLQTNWKHKYIFEFVIPDPKTVFKRRSARHDEGYFPVDDNLSIEMVTQQAEVYRAVALHLHRAKMHVYIREDIHSPPMRIVEKGVVSTPAWLLSKSEQTGGTVSVRSWKNFFLKRKKINWIALTEKPQDINQSCRIAHDGKSFELQLGSQLLHFHPEIPLGVKKKNIQKNWLIYSPLSCSIKNILGFARIRVGESVIIGRENDLYATIFDLDKSVAKRHLQITNSNGDLIMTPLNSERALKIMRTDDQDNRERVEAHRYEAIISVRQMYGGLIAPLPADEALALLKRTNAIIEQDTFAVKTSEKKAGGIISLPDYLTPLIIGDLHAQVDNLLKILTENYLIECLYANTACLVILGDAVHSEIAGEMEDMDNSILMMDLIFKLKTLFPDNIFYIRGNHDSFDPELSKNGISQGLLMQQRLLELRGAEYIAEMKKLYTSLPYIAKNSSFCACHAAPPMSKVSLKELIHIRKKPKLINDLTTKRVQRQHYLNGYKKKDVRRFRKVLELSKNAPFIVGHTPMDPFGSFWRDVSNIKGHHILYSGHQEGPQALLVEGTQLIPLKFPAEPVTKLIDKIR